MLNLVDYESFMRAALAQAQAARDAGEVPVGAILVNSENEIVSSGHNRREQLNDPLAHAEIQALMHLEKTDWRLEDLTMFVTLEPCVMCAAAIQQSRIAKLVFGAWDEKAGGSGSLYDITRDSRLGKPVEVITGVLEEDCKQILREFFSSARPTKPEK